MPTPLRRAARDALGLVRLLYAREADEMSEPALARCHALHDAGELLAAAERSPSPATRARAGHALDALRAGSEDSTVKALLATAADRVWAGERPVATTDGTTKKEAQRIHRQNRS